MCLKTKLITQIGVHHGTYQRHNRLLQFYRFICRSWWIVRRLHPSGLFTCSACGDEPYAAQTLETRTGYYYLKAQGKLDIYKDYISGKITRDEFLQHIPEEQLQSVFCETMSNETLPRLFENIDRILTQRGIKQVDVIIGGPPCQAYSLVGRAQSKHMETPMSADPRNDLYKLYARFLQKYHPKMFVFENVMGIKSANSGATWLKVQEALRSVGYEIECHEKIQRILVCCKTEEE